MCWSMCTNVLHIITRKKKCDHKFFSCLRSFKGRFLVTQCCRCHQHNIKWSEKENGSGRTLCVQQCELALATVLPLAYRVCSIFHLGPNVGDCPLRRVQPTSLLCCTTNSCRWISRCTGAVDGGQVFHNFLLQFASHIVVLVLTTVTAHEPCWHQRRDRTIKFFGFLWLHLHLCSSRRQTYWWES